MDIGNILYQPFVSPEDILYQYDEILLGNRTNCSTLISAKESGNKYTDAILRYCFDKFLCWTPQDIVNGLTKEIVGQFKLAPFIEKRIPRPSEFDEWEYQYVGWYLYPDTYTLSNDERIIKVYMEVVDGKRKRFPKSFFDENAGEHRAFVCFRVMSNEFIQPTSIKQLYEIFGDEQGGRRLLSKYKLIVPVRSIFGTPLDYLHATLEDEWNEDDDLYDKHLEQAQLRAGKQKGSCKDDNEEDEDPDMDDDGVNDDSEDEDELNEDEDGDEDGFDEDFSYGEPDYDGDDYGEADEEDSDDFMTWI